MNQEQFNLFERILSYVIDSEKQHFEESEEPANHIYALACEAMKQLANVDTVTLNSKECLDLTDALEEWLEVIGPKELQDSEVGLNAERDDALIKKLEGC